MGNSYRYLIVLAIILLLIGLSSLKVAKTGLTIASGEEEPEDMGELTQLGCGDGNCRMDAGETCVSCGADCGDCPPEQPPATCTDYDANEPINGVYTSNYAALSGGTGKDSAQIPGAVIHRNMDFRGPGTDEFRGSARKN